MYFRKVSIGLAGLARVTKDTDRERCPDKPWTLSEEFPQSPRAWEHCLKSGA